MYCCLQESVCFSFNGWKRGCSSSLQEAHSPQTNLCVSSWCWPATCLQSLRQESVLLCNAARGFRPAEIPFVLALLSPLPDGITPEGCSLKENTGCKNAQLHSVYFILCAHTPAAISFAPMVNHYKSHEASQSCFDFVLGLFFLNSVALWGCSSFSLLY